MVDCIFCKIINKEINASTIYEDNNWLVFLDVNPIVEGHCLIIPKKHCETIFDLPETEARELGIIMKKVSEKLGNTPTIALQSYINPFVFDSIKPA